MKRRPPDGSLASGGASLADREMKIASTRLLAHHYGDWKLVDGQYIIDVGGLADAISTGAIERIRFGYFDEALLDRSINRVDGANHSPGGDFFPAALARPALALIAPDGDVLVIDGHRRARHLFTRHGETQALLIAVSFEDAMVHGARVDGLSPAERRLIETMRSHPVRFTADPNASVGARLVPVHIPPAEEGRPSAAHEIGVLAGAFHALAREISKRAGENHGKDPRRRVRTRTFSKERYLREIVVSLGDFSLTPNLAVAMSTLQAEYAEAVTDLRRYSKFYLGHENAVLYRLLAGEDSELKTRFVFISRALAAAKWDQSHAKAFGAMIDPLSHAKKRWGGAALYEKITGGETRLAMRDLPLRALCDVARLVGINVARHYPQLAHAYEIVEWHRLVFFLEQGRWREAGERSLAMNFSLWHRLWQIAPPVDDATTLPEIALLWGALFTTLAATAVPPDAPRSGATDLLELCLERSDEHFHARRGPIG